MGFYMQNCPQNCFFCLKLSDSHCWLILQKRRCLLLFDIVSSRLNQNIGTNFTTHWKKFCYCIHAPIWLTLVIQFLLKMDPLSSVATSENKKFFYTWYCVIYQGRKHLLKGASEPAIGGVLYRCRSSRPEVLCKKVFLKFRRIHWKTPVPESLF